LKAQLVAKGYTQIYDVDYFEIFSAVARLHSVHILLSVAVVKQWFLYQLDIKNIFLHENLQEHVYMLQPPIMRFSGRWTRSANLKKQSLIWNNLHKRDLTNLVLLHIMDWDRALLITLYLYDILIPTLLFLQFMLILLSPEMIIKVSFSLKLIWVFIFIWKTLSFELFSRNWGYSLFERSFFVSNKIRYWFVRRNWYIRI